jgi:hypothetical protein
MILTFLCRYDLGCVDFNQGITKAGLLLEYRAGIVRVFASIEEAPTGDGVLKYRNYGFFEAFEIEPFPSGPLSVTLQEGSNLLGVYEVDMGTV